MGSLDGFPENPLPPWAAGPSGSPRGNQCRRVERLRNTIWAARVLDREIDVPTPAPPGVRRFQHGMTALLVLAFAVPTYWMIGSWRQSRSQQRVAARIEELGGSVTWGGDGIGFKRLGGGYVWRVDLNGTDATDNDFAQLKLLTELHALSANETRVTSRGLAHLEGLNNLVSLDLGLTQITDEGLRYLGDLPRLKILNLQGTHIGDAGVAHLRNLTSLEHLDLSHTQISDAALAHLASMDQLSRLELDHTQITDKGLQQLKKISKPNATLNLFQTGVTDAGVAELKKEAPNWHVRHY